MSQRCIDCFHYIFIRTIDEKTNKKGIIHLCCNLAKEKGHNTLINPYKDRNCETFKFWNWRPNENNK